MATWLITGANRGIGLEFAKHLRAKGESVIATARRPADAEELSGLGVEVLALDVSDQASVDAFAEEVGGRAVDVLINNAGMNPRECDGLSDLDLDDMMATFRTNAGGPLLVTRALLPALAKGSRKLVVNISSQMGSIGKAISDKAGGNYAYRSSKSALNMVTTLMAEDLRDKGITCVMMHPGWVRTDMGGPQATLSTDESVSGMLSVIDRLTPRDSGVFIDPAGKPLPW